MMLYYTQIWLKTFLYIKRKLKIDFYDMGHLYSVIGILEYAGFDEISLCSVVWKTPHPIEKEGRKVSIDYDEIFEVKVLWKQ